MTPFGIRMRELRTLKGVNQKQMAHDLKISAAYLSALERGHRGEPSWQFLQRVIGYFNIIWDEAEELERLASVSHTRVVVDTEKLTAEATLLANNLAKNISQLTPGECEILNRKIEEMAKSS